MADFDDVPSPDTSRAPGVRAFGSPDAPASSFEVSREALAAKAFSAGAVFGAGANPRDEAPACRVGDAAERRLAARLAKDSGPPVRPPVPAPLGGRPVSRADALDTVHNLDDMLMAALAASRPWATFVEALEERAPAPAEPRVFERAEPLEFERAEPRPRLFFPAGAWTWPSASRRRSSSAWT